MVPGALGTRIPWRAASPDRGLTWHSTPSGSSISSPVETALISPGTRTKSGSAERTSYPADPGVARVGRGRSAFDANLLNRTTVIGSPCHE